MTIISIDGEKLDTAFVACIETEPDYADRVRLVARMKVGRSVDLAADLTDEQAEELMTEIRDGIDYGFAQLNVEVLYKAVLV